MSGTSSHFEDSVSSKENRCEEVNLIIQGKEELKVSRVNVDTGESLTHDSFSDTSTRVNQLSSRVPILNLSLKICHTINCAIIHSHS